MSNVITRDTGVAVIGLGAMGRVHLDCYGSDHRTVIRRVCDADPSSPLRLDDPGFELSTIDEIESDTEIGIVSVCVPHNLHAQLAQRLLTAGKDVILEKPMATSAAELTELYATAERSASRLVVKSYLRHAAPFAELHRLVREHRIGDINLVNARFASRRYDDETPSWRTQRHASGGGCLLDSGIHLVDIIHWCFGHEDEVFANADATGTHDIETTAAITMRFSSGPITTVSVSQNGPPDTGPAFRVELTGTTAQLVVETAGPSLLLTERRNGVTTVLLEESDWWFNANRNALSTYVTQLRSGVGDSGSLVDAAGNVASILAAYESIRDGRPHLTSRPALLGKAATS